MISDYYYYTIFKNKDKVLNVDKNKKALNSAFKLNYLLAAIDKAVRIMRKHKLTKKPNFAHP
jgi:hypothetical protein